MALAPYWLSPTLWPFPVPVMVKEPPEGRLNAPAPPAVTDTVPVEVMAVAVSPWRVV